jgi:hypothetical protein
MAWVSYSDLRSAKDAKVIEVMWSHSLTLDC